MFKRLIFLSILLLTIGSNSFAQIYGNEWINFSQKYFKITITKEGLYKITFDDVTAKNIQTGILDPSKFQLFNKGIEVPLYITGSNDNQFNQGDIIYFYGVPNNASLDKPLYQNPSDLPNDQVNLFTDENYYFLTYNPSQNGIRYNLVDQSPTGLTSENYILEKSRLNLATNYYPGAFIIAAMSPSEYIEGEGYLGDLIAKGQTVSFNLSTSGYINAANFQNQLSFYLAGRSNASSTDSKGQNHHILLSDGTNTLFDSTYKAYSTIRKTVPVSLNSNSFNLSVTVKDDLGAVTDYQAPGYFEINYSRNLNLSGLNQLSFSINKTTTKALLNFNSSSLINPIILEKGGNDIAINVGSVNPQFVLANVNPDKEYFLSDQNAANSVALVDVNFKNLNASTSKDFLIISNYALNSGALTYQSYNESVGISTSVAFTDDLYNEFYYGFHHPQALRNYCQFMIDKGNIKPEYLLLLGKGYETPKGNLTNDLVPTIGYPASDNMITSGLNGSNLEPGLMTGRIPAKTNDDILNYLEKLKAYRQLPNAIWRKNILQVTGGKTSSEQSSFRSYQDNYFSKVNAEYFGAYRTQIYKNVSTPITENQTQSIIDKTALGVGLLSYFGHGSATGTEISFGKPSDQKNLGKPTIYLINGCSTGESFTDGNSLGEDFILAKSVGAVGWIGTSSEGVASYLGSSSSNFYDFWSKNDYGKPICKGIQDGLKKFQNPNDLLNRAHTRQYIFLGDPSLKFFNADLPDFQIDNSSIFLTESNQNATQPNLKITLVINNLGKALADSLNLKLERTLSNSVNPIISNIKIAPIFNTDTVKLNLSNIGLDVAGTNKIKVTLDPNQLIPEVNDLNNIANFEFFLPGNGIEAIYPIRNGVINQNQVILKAEPDNLKTKNAEYLFEIDTVPDFSSPFKIASPTIAASVFPKWKPSITLKDNQTYFWRVRINLPVNQGGNWVYSSFTYIPSISDGESFHNKNQFKEFQASQIKLDTLTGRFSFENSYSETSIYTEGDDGPNRSAKRFRTDQSVSFSDSGFPGITLVAMSNLKYNKFFSYPSPYNSTNGPVLVNGYTGQYFWNINDPVQVDSMVRFINQIPNNYYVIGFNGINAAINQLPQYAKDALASFGLVKYNLINLGEPYMFWGKKGTSPGTALEFTADYSSSTPPRQQSLQYFNILPFPLSSGGISSTPIGPAKKWNAIQLKFQKDTAAHISYNLIGSNSPNNTTSGVTLYSNIQDSIFNLSTVDAKLYPYLTAKINVSNNTTYTIPDLKYINFDYQPRAEISINPDSINSFQSEKIQEGDSIRWKIAIKNIYQYNSDTVSLSYVTTNPSQNIQSYHIENIPSLVSGDGRVINITIPTLGKVGKNNISFKINTNDFYPFNNQISYDYEVIKDDKTPLVSVSFDGKQIINGEIVSPSPLISIQAVDENKFLLMKDTSLVEISIKKESDQNFQRIYFTNPKVQFFPASSTASNDLKINFQPDALPDGVYTLKVRAKDFSGNYINNDYLINFEVINESTITQFYPYPNPVVNSMKFVFTLTGSKIPDKIKILIYNSSGKIVRVINKEELGNIKIGNNISDFTWDGTDDFGDRLANGVYFYKVQIADQNNNFSHKQSGGDQFFKNNVGKIYLLK